MTAISAICPPTPFIPRSKGLSENIPNEISWSAATFAWRSIIRLLDPDFFAPASKTKFLNCL
jgi:hypothetical protein